MALWLSLGVADEGLQFLFAFLSAVVAAMSSLLGLL